MAVDSRNKRTSAANLPFMPLYPEPDSSAGTVGDRMQTAGLYFLPSWVSADGVNLDAGWDNSENAHDGNTATFASEQIGAQTPLELEWAADLRTDKFRIFAHDVDIIAGTHDATNVKIEIWYDSAWHDFGAFTLPEDEWFEYPLGKDILGDKIKITSEDTEERLYVGEVQFVDLSNFLPGSAGPLLDGNLTSNPLLKGGLIR